MKFIGILFISVLLLLPTTVTAKAPAESTTDISVSPAITEWAVAPGQKTTKTIIVRNTTNDIVPIQTFVQPMHIEEPMSAASRNRYDAAQWFTVKNPDFILRAKQSRKVTITIAVPKNAEPGGKYATIYFRQLSSASFTPQTYIVPRVGVLSMVIVKGKITKWLQPEGIDLEKQNKSLHIKTRVQNTGNVHAFLQGSLVITDWWGKEVARLPLQMGMVMPETTRTFSNDWKPPTPGIYTVKTEIHMGSRQLPSISATAWWLPWFEILLLAAAMFFVWFGVIKIRHRWRRALRALKK